MIGKMLDFRSPQTPSECLDSLKNGGTPFSKYDVQVQADADRVEIDVVDLSYWTIPTQRRLGMAPDSSRLRKRRTIVSFRGTLEPDAVGTHVLGRISSSLGAEFIVAAAVLVVFSLIVLYILFGPTGNSRYWGLPLILLLVRMGFLIRDIWRDAAKRRNTLAQWIKNCLN